MLWVFWAAFAFIYVLVCLLEFLAPKKQPDLSVLLLVKDGQEEVEGVVRDIERLVRWRQGRLELVVVDCGSLDETPLILGKMKREGLNFKLIWASGLQSSALGLIYCSGREVLDFIVPHPEIETRKLFFRVWKASNSVHVKRAG